MAGSIFERLRASFNDGEALSSSEKPDALSRYFGGNERKNQPYISGYWQFLVRLPSAIFSTDKTKYESWFHSAAEGFTPPTRTLNKADLPGQGGIGSSFITGQTLTRTFTVTFREYKELPILTSLELWTSVIDAYTGVSPLSAAQWMPSSYKGSAFVILTKPVQSFQGAEFKKEDIEQIYYFEGVFPESAPHDTFGQDIATNDFIQHSVSFSFDGWPLTKADPDVITAAISALSGKTYYNTFTGFETRINSTATPASAE
jgi:hypothetical protein